MLEDHVIGAGVLDDDGESVEFLTRPSKSVPSISGSAGSFSRRAKLREDVLDVGCEEGRGHGLWQSGANLQQRQGSGDVLDVSSRSPAA